MVIANNHIYSGRSDGVIWRCSAEKSRNCQDLKVFEGKRKNIKIAEIDYNPADGQIHAVQSVLNENCFGEKWSHRFMRCASIAVGSCYEVSTELKGWATIHVTFDAVWIADLGLIRKCPFNHLNRNSTINDKNCFEFHNFDQCVYLNIGASNKYLYVRLDNYVWRCDPEKLRSCSRAMKVQHKSNIGPFIVV